MNQASSLAHNCQVLANLMDAAVVLLTPGVSPTANKLL